MRRLFLAVLVLGLLGCNEDDLLYADCASWEPVMPFIPPSIPLGSMDARQQAQYFAQAGIQATGGGGPNGNGVRTFEADLDGFSGTVTVEFSYVDFGVYVALWSEFGGTGTSNATFFGLPSGSLPENIRPRISMAAFSADLVDDSNEAVAVVIISTTGSVSFRRHVGGTSSNPYSAVGWTNTGNKGVSDGFYVTYLKLK